MVQLQAPGEARQSPEMSDDRENKLRERLGIAIPLPRLLEQFSTEFSINRKPIPAEFWHSRKPILAEFWHSREYPRVRPKSLRTYGPILGEKNILIFCSY